MCVYVYAVSVTLTPVAKAQAVVARSRRASDACEPFLSGVVAFTTLREEPHDAC